MDNRLERTLGLMHRWGYAPCLDSLARELLGGSVTRAELISATGANPQFRVRNDFVCLAGRESLLESSEERVVTNRSMNGDAKVIARKFATDLLQMCPLIDCIAVSGSVGSGGYRVGDDIDFDLFVRDGSKYLVYALAVFLGMRYTLRYRRSYGLRKLICVNVVWPASQSSPFQRQDEDVAFELLHCIPLFGAAYFREILTRNAWTNQFFPQLRDALYASDQAPPTSFFGRAVAWVSRRPVLLSWANASARLVSRVAYSFTHLVRHRDPVARQHFEFIRRVKYPYEVFQD